MCVVKTSHGRNVDLKIFLVTYRTTALKRYRHNAMIIDILRKLCLIYRKRHGSDYESTCYARDLL